MGHTGYTTGNACHFEMHVNGTLVEPRYFTAYDGSDAAELTQERQMKSWPKLCAMRVPTR